MIVRQDSDGSLVMITQNDHAKAAGFCAKHWGNARFAKPKPYESTIRAAFLHDLPWLREEACPLFDPQTCRTPNYLTVANESQLAEYKWANDWVYRVDKYAGLLVSKHRTGIWNARYGLMRLPQYKLRNLHPSIQEHIAISHEEQDAVAADFDARELTTNYILLQVWDLFSLYICSNESLKEESYDPVPTGYAEGAAVVMRLKPISGRRISVDPYPFDQPSLDINVVYRRLPTAMFQNEQAFLESYFATPLQVATFTFIDPATGSH